MSEFVSSGPQNLNSKSELTEFSYLQYVVWPVLDTTTFYKLTKSAQVEIESCAKKSQTHSLSVLAGTNHDLVKTWLAGLATDKPIEPNNKDRSKHLAKDILAVLNPQDCCC